VRSAYSRINKHNTIHELILNKAEIRFLKGRVAFKGINTKGEYTETKKGKHDSMIVIFRENQL